MYLQFFGLTEAPFSITPDPAFVYLSAAHRDALAHLLYGVGKGGAGGFVQLTGEVGTGKTTLCRCLLEQVPDDTIIALILNPMVTPKELLAAICEELDINVDGIRDSTKSMVDELNVCLLHHHAQGRRVVVVIDEAQNLSPEALEQVRLLTNLETAKHKLLQMVLLGQPELRQLLQRQNLRQLAQRITARYHLAPLQEKETVAYVRHRMQVAGARHNPFTRSAMRALHKCSGGVPRLINIIADRALAGAYAREKERVDASMVRNAANEVRPSEIHVRSGPSPLLLSGAALVAFLMLAAVVLELSWQSREQVELPHVTQTSPSSEDTESRQTPEAMGAQPATTAAMQADVVPPAATSKPKNAAMAEKMQAVPTAQSQPMEQVWPLDTNWLIRQQGLAWVGLADLWQDPGAANAIQAACDGQERTGYACLRDQGSWSRVKKLGLPVILVLQNDGPKEVLLSGMGDDFLLLGVGDQSKRIDREDVDSRWLGDYIVVWPQGPDWPTQIRRGEAGAAVNITMELARQAQPAWTGGGVFDAGFEQWLMTFQRQNGLNPDGIIGPKTLLYLMAPTIIEPRLQLPAEENS